MHVLQGLPLTYLVLVPPHDGLSLVNPLMKKEHLGAGGSQLHLCSAKGSPGSIRTPRHFIQLGLNGGGPALRFDPNQLQPFSVLALKIRASLRHATVNLLLDLGFPRGDFILRLGHQALPRLQLLEV